MAPPTSNTANGAAVTSRARPQASRRKANHAADDAAYHGVISSNALAGSKRGAAEKADGEPRLKRKRLEPTNATTNGVSSSATVEKESKPSMIDFSTLPIDAIHRYLTQFDIVPDIEPMATTAFDPPPPSSLLRQHGHRSTSASPVPQPLPPTPANRPRRELSASANRRRSSRLLEDDRQPTVAPVLSDVGDVHKTLAHVVERHFRDHTVKEVDTLASFMCAVKAKGETFFCPCLFFVTRCVRLSMGKMAHLRGRSYMMGIPA
ncbi:hypothetical protein BDY19DRAFT_1069732 [Irpex rosettiformis]|uniref:Uncharacterized protein n=1 Tax=Irpex rosettiformis TaxID=378272 RepID=A0ACB8U6K7_9APHY|nr:hypothetical protein BDY19DRAFT_1069732 [Irpex rosettiformis]